MSKIILILRNIIAIPFIIFMVFFVITPICYISSFMVSRKKHRLLLAKLVGFVRFISFKILGITFEFRGVENIIKEPCIIASNHQSIIETTLLFNILIPNTTYCLKKEIAQIPAWKRIINKFGGILVDRGNAGAIFKKLVKDVVKSLNEGDSVVIFPEGTRAKLGKPKKFKKGISIIYKESQRPILPIALNTGKILSKDAKLIHSGHIIVEFLKPIEANLDEKEMLHKLETSIHKKALELSKI